MRAHTILTVAVAAATIVGCRRAPRTHREIKQESTSDHDGALPRRPEASYVIGTPIAQSEPDTCAGLDAYPLPRTYEQILANAPKEARKPTGMLEARMIIGPDGKITHLQFVRLSSLDSVNKRALEFVRNQHYKPAIMNGERVPVCSTMLINVDFQ